MRHLGSILLSLVLAAGVYVLVGIGSVRLGVALAITGHDYTNEAIGAAALLAAGALYAAMVLPRLSPLGPLLAALAFLGVEVYALVARGRTVRGGTVRGGAGRGATRRLPAVPAAGGGLVLAAAVQRVPATAAVPDVRVAGVGFADIGFAGVGGARACRPGRGELGDP